MLRRAAQRLKIRAPTLLLALIGLLLAYPQLEGVVSQHLLSLLMAAVLVSAVYTIGTDRKHLIRGLALGVPAVVANFALSGPHPLGSVASNTFQLVFLVYVVGALFAFVLRPDKVDIEKLSAAGALYLLLGLTWAVGFKIVELRHPGSFSVPDSEVLSLSDLLYFSYVTMTTLGYGDITPASNYARSLAVLEAMTGTFFVAVLVARLVSLYGKEQSD